jgi:hypothetical protein
MLRSVTLGHRLPSHHASNTLYCSAASVRDHRWLLLDSEASNLTHCKRNMAFCIVPPHVALASLLQCHKSLHNLLRQLAIKRHVVTCWSCDMFRQTGDQTLCNNVLLCFLFAFLYVGSALKGSQDRVCFCSG